MTGVVKTPFEVKGWHVLIAIIIFFGIISAVNAVMVTLALRSFPGEEQKKSYLQGLQYNEVLSERAIQSALGWRAEMLDGAMLASGEPIRIQITDADGNPIANLSMTGIIVRPATDQDDTGLVFREQQYGVYVAPVNGLSQGAWDFSATGRDTSGNVFTVEKRLWVK